MVAARPPGRRAVALRRSDLDRRRSGSTAGAPPRSAGWVSVMRLRGSRDISTTMRSRMILGIGLLSNCGSYGEHDVRRPPAVPW